MSEMNTASMPWSLGARLAEARRGYSRVRGTVPGMTRSLVVKVTTGAESPERCNQGFTVAAAGVAAGAVVSLWLTGEAAWFAVPGKAEEFTLPLATPLADLLAVVRDEGTVTLCTQCAARRDLTQADVLPGIRIAGAAGFVEESLAEGAQALVY